MHQGWLLKKGGVGVGAAKSWIKRYFVLYNTSQVFILFRAISILKANVSHLRSPLHVFLAGTFLILLRRLHRVSDVFQREKLPKRGGHRKNDIHSTWLQQGRQ